MKGLRYILIASLAAGLLCILAYLILLPETIAPFFNGLLMMGLPAALAFYLARRFQLSWRLFGFGALTFIISQLAHIPFNAWTLNPIMQNLGLSATPGSLDLALRALLVGLSAGAFEETARLLVYRRWLQDAKTWAQGLMFGAGHGGAEAILLGALALAVFLQALTLRSPELIDLVPPGQLETVRAGIEVYWLTPWYQHLLPTLERLAAISFHLAAALLVLQAVLRGKLRWYFAAILAHSLFNAVAEFGLGTWGTVAAEVLILLMGLLSLGLIFALRDQYFSATLPPDAD